MSQIRPKITSLSERQISQVHQYSLDILSSVGVRVDSEKARAIFAQAIGRPADGDRVTVPSDLVEWALQAAPATINVYDRLGNSAFVLRDGPARFGIGVTALYYRDPATDAVTQFTRKQMETTTRLGDALPNLDAISTVGIVQDVAPELVDLYATLGMIANSHKSLVMLASDHERFPAVIELLEVLHGDLASRPFIIPYFNPISPLVLNKGTVDKMLVTIEKGLPFIFSNFGMAGATRRRSRRPAPWCS